MGIYDSNVNLIDSELDDETKQIMFECWLFDDLSRLPDKQRKELLESAEYADVRKAWMEAGLINKVSIMKLSKESDLERRESSAILALARANGHDADYAKYVKLKAETRRLKDNMRRRYGNRAKLNARKGQKEYISKNGISNLTLSSSK